MHMMCSVVAQQENIFLYETKLIAAAAELKFVSVLCRVLIFNTAFRRT